MHERRMRSGGGLVGREPRLLSTSGGGAPIPSGNNCGPFPEDAVLAPRQDEPGYMALWTRSPYVLGQLR